MPGERPGVEGEWARLRRRRISLRLKLFARRARNDADSGVDQDTPAKARPLLRRGFRGSWIIVNSDNFVIAKRAIYVPDSSVFLVLRRGFNGLDAVMNFLPGVFSKVENRNGKTAAVLKEPAGMAPARLSVFSASSE